jgi:Uma2 family endonuclease
MTRQEEPDMPRDASTKLTYEDFLNFPDDGRRHELIDGEHYVSPSPNTRHQRLVARLFDAIYGHLKVSPDGEVFLAPFDVVISNFDVVEPDLVFVAADQSDILTDKHVRGTPALVIEILSPGTRKTDELTKRRLYDRAGVREYWIVDPELDVVKVFRREADGLPRVAELTTPLLPGLAISLPELLR